MNEAIRDWTPTAALLGAALLIGQAPHQGAPWWASAFVSAAAVGLRNGFPVAMLGISTLCTAAHLLTGAPVGIVDCGLLICLYAVDVRRPRPVSALTLPVLLLALAGWSGVYVLRGHLVPGLPVLAFEVGHAPAARPELGVRPSDAARWSGPVVLGSLFVAARIHSPTCICRQATPRWRTRN
ncbi:hypothetical protein [Mangrovihabitans endophyticus]|uniref:Uncharacterized protein n=1 Tax=Mangrovihabitans endophyticus TaxID=1751298 RepID=A0A8J3FLZ3_9ACTN|nr:hypothetical protein [Mangrovihabitans endophyticus]GGK79555.1 hypothetical protein GCM10012284_11940 [Mangrovihabitans endophyticus]